MGGSLSGYQRQFIDFLVTSEALTFGDFVTKSGRKTPYFINTGRFNDGAKISELGRYYAAHILELGLGGATTIFGPAYKGIPLALSTAIALTRDHKKTVGYSFDRKELKDHGDKGRIVGHQISDGDKIVIVEDVITAGTTMREVVPLLHSLAKVEILAVVLSVDRRERGTGNLSAVDEAQNELGIRVCPIVTIHDIVAHLSENNGTGPFLSNELKQNISSYLEQYGA